MSKVYKIIDRQRSSDSYFFSDTSYHWEIVRIKDNLSVMDFYGTWSEGTSHCHQDGVESVKFITDNKIEVKYFDKEKKSDVIDLDELAKKKENNS